MQSSTEVSAAVIELYALYNPVTPTNIGRLAVAAQFEASLATQESAVDGKDDQVLTREATDALELVDDLERLY